MGRLVEVGQAVDGQAGDGLLGRHDLGVLRPGGVVVGHADGGDARRQARLVGHRGHRLAVDEDPGPVAPQRLPVLLGGEHGHGAPLWFSPPPETVVCRCAHT